MDLVDEIDSTKAQHVLINSMAASNLGVQTQGTSLDQNVGNGNLDVIFKVFWVMNRNKDSVTLLRSFMDTMKSAVVYPVLNLYFGKEEEFSFYHTNEDLHEIISQRGGCQLTFPNLNDLIADKFYTDEVTIEKLPKGLKLGMRTVLERWLRVVKETFEGFYFPPHTFNIFPQHITIQFIFHIEPGEVFEALIYRKISPMIHHMTDHMKFSLDRKSVV